MQTVKVENDTEVKMTKDYMRFKRIKGNRKLYPGHVEYLRQVLLDKPDMLSYNPILVNERFEIIDGQHRLIAAEKAEVPVYYIMHKNLKLRDIQALNSGTKP